MISQKQYITFIQKKKKNGMLEKYVTNYWIKKLYLKSFNCSNNLC